MPHTNTFSQRLILKTGFWLVLLFCMTMLLPACRSTGSSGSVSSSPDVELRYNKYNIHAQRTWRDVKASYAGYVDSGDGHYFIPAGSELEFPGKGRRWRNGFYFKVLDTGQEVFFEFHSGRMEMSEDEYIQLITSETPVSLSRFSDIDMKGIKAGKVYKGMSKQGVLTALGYPAKHRTPSLDSSTWIYWRNRFLTMAVNFDSNGIVRSVTQ